MDILVFINQYWYVLAIFGGFLVFYIVFSIILKKKARRGADNFLQKYPQAAKIYLSSRVGITNEIVQVLSVNDETPTTFYKGSKSGVYAPPGIVSLQADYSYQRPSVMYKSVTKSTGITKVNVETLPNKSYILGYDRKEEKFTFETFED